VIAQQQINRAHSSQLNLFGSFKIRASNCAALAEWLSCTQKQASSLNLRKQKKINTPFLAPKNANKKCKKVMRYFYWAFNNWLCTRRREFTAGFYPISSSAGEG